jgi:group I intron endonuclease
MESGIYAIRHVVSGKRYIGSSKRIERRWKEHKYRLNKGDHCTPHLQNAWNLYGADAFVFEIIESGVPKSRERLMAREQYYFDTMFPEYNNSRVASSPSMDPLVGARISAIQTGRGLHKQWRMNISKGMKNNPLIVGRAKSPTHIAKMRHNALKQWADPAWRAMAIGRLDAIHAQFIGSTHSDEWRQHQSEGIKRAFQDPEHLANLTRANRERADAQRGVPLSDEHRQHVSDGNRRRYEDPEERNRTGDSIRGITRSEATKQLLRERAAERWASPEYRAKFTASRKGVKRKPKE